VATPAPPARVVTGGGSRQSGGSTFGGGGGGSGIGFGIGAAGLALGVGLVGAMGRTQTWSGQNGTRFETGPPPEDAAASDQTEPRTVRKRHPRTQLPSSDNRPTRTVKSDRAKPRLSQTAISVPSITDVDFVPGEILVVIRGGVTPSRLERFETEAGLTLLSSVRIALLEAEVRRYGLRRGALVPSALASLRGSTVVLSAQPNYRFDLQDATSVSKPVNTPAATTAAPTQYAVGALRVDEAHTLATGDGIRIAIIDSGIDETNPELKDTVVEHFDALGQPFKPHSHGTAMAGAIVAHHTLVGIAPNVRLLAIRAFAGSTGSAAGTGFDILRGLDFAAAHGARIVNLSFAGPRDPLLHAALLAARQRGIIAVAAAGNAGPLSKPLYPGADTGIIAVTATDAAGKPFALANRGAYVAVAAPGVDVIAPGLGDSVQMTSGTSIATAEASGVVALMLERQPKATPDDIRKMLSATAHALAVEPTAAGAGLIDAAAAVRAAKGPLK
jgi:subtilisin family serine protease